MIMLLLIKNTLFFFGVMNLVSWYLIMDGVCKNSVNFDKGYLIIDACMCNFLWWYSYYQHFYDFNLVNKWKCSIKYSVWKLAHQEVFAYFGLNRWFGCQTMLVFGKLVRFVFWQVAGAFKIRWLNLVKLATPISYHQPLYKHP